MASTVSVIIPTLNEGNYLPALLSALACQTRRPDEIIVADAGSTDRTALIARGAGAKVVLGGRPAVGRNAGIREASGDLFLFLDADVLPEPDFVSKCIFEFQQRALDVATCMSAALSPRLSDYLLHEAANSYLRLLRPVSPRAFGFCILVRRSIFTAVGGFDESLLLGEDHDFVRRAEHYGKFRVLTSVRLPVSVRRLDDEGLTRLFFKYLWAESHAWAGRPIHSIPFEYSFGTHRVTDRHSSGFWNNKVLLWTSMSDLHFGRRLGNYSRQVFFVDAMNQRLNNIQHRVHEFVDRQK